MNSNEYFYDLSGLSYKGKRAVNEDSIVCLKIIDDFWLLAIADGVGGGVHGEYASKYVVNAITDFLILKSQEGIIDSQLKPLLTEIFDYAQDIISEKILELPRLSGMKTTLSVLLLYQDKYVCGNIGDSPIFIYSDNKLTKLVKEHTFNNETNFPNKNSTAYNFNVLTKVIDGGADKPDIYPVARNFYQFQKGETLVLCSDGIYSSVIKSFNFYKKILSKEYSVEQKNIEIIQEAYNNESTDNISVILFEARDYREPIYRNPKNKKHYLKRKHVLLFLISLTLLLITILLLDLTGYYQFYNYSPVYSIQDSVVNEITNGSVSDTILSNAPVNIDTIASENENLVK